MTFTDLLLIAISLSMDAFAVAMCKGLSVCRAKLKHYIITAVYFGGFQAMMPFLGFLAGYSFERVITSFDYIVAFVLLALIGGNMIKEALGSEDTECNDNFGVKTMIPLALATSIDALAVGVTLAAKGSSLSGSYVSNIFFDVTVIGITTFIISAIGIKIGNVFGIKYKQKAELAGGIILIIMGLRMFIEHFI